MTVVEHAFRFMALTSTFIQNNAFIEKAEHRELLEAHEFVSQDISLEETL